MDLTANVAKRDRTVLIVRVFEAPSSDHAPLGAAWATTVSATAVSATVVSATAVSTTVVSRAVALVEGFMLMAATMNTAIAIRTTTRTAVTATSW